MKGRDNSQKLKTYLSYEYKDTKIASKVLALRIKKVIPYLIYYDQTAYEKGRFIDKSIRIIDDILYHTDQENSDRIYFQLIWKRPLALWNMLSSSIPLQIWVWYGLHKMDRNFSL